MYNNLAAHETFSHSLHREMGTGTKLVSSARLLSDEFRPLFGEQHGKHYPLIALCDLQYFKISFASLPSFLGFLLRIFFVSIDFSREPPFWTFQVEVCCTVFMVIIRHHPPNSSAIDVRNFCSFFFT